jgi:hypothetical protein
VGFLGDSNQDGYRRLYLDDDLTVFVEFNVEFVVYDHQLAADQSPFIGEPATTVTLTPNAEFAFESGRTRTYTSDEWQLDPPIWHPGCLPPEDNSDIHPMFRKSHGYCLKSTGCW